MWSKLRVLVAAAACVAVVSPSQASGTGRTAPTCREPEATTAYTRRVERALGARRDVWGQKLLAQAGGPTYASARRYLAPLLYAVGPGGRRVTASGVYYLPFTFPHSVGGPRGFGLHVADGSEILVRRVGGPSLTIFVGAGDGERYGSCLARLQTPRLAQGYLPILETSYVDRHGVLYTEESFAGRLPNRRSLVSFVHVRADARLSLTGSAVRFAPSRGATIRALVLAGHFVRRSGHGMPFQGRREADAEALAADADRRDRHFHRLAPQFARQSADEL